MTNKKPYSDSRWHEPLKPSIVGETEITKEQKKKNKEFEKEFEKALESGKIKLKKKK